MSGSSTLSIRNSQIFSYYGIGNRLPRKTLRSTNGEISAHLLLEKLAAWVPPPRVHPVRYGGCLAAPSQLRGAITPTPRQQGAWRRIAAITKPSVIRRLLRPLKLAALPPPIAPARLVQEPFAWVSAYITDGDGMVGP